MKLFGYPSSAFEQQVLLELSEASLLASAAELRAIAGFRLQDAGTMNDMGKSFDHLHLSDSLRQV